MHTHAETASKVSKLRKLKIGNLISLGCQNCHGYHAATHHNPDHHAQAHQNSSSVSNVTCEVEVGVVEEDALAVMPVHLWHPLDLQLVRKAHPHARAGHNSLENPVVIDSGPHRYQKSSPA